MASKLLWFSFFLLAVTTVASCNYASTLQDSSHAVKTAPDLADTLCPTWFTPALVNDSVWCECKTKTVQRGLVLRCPSKNKICVQNCIHQERHSTDALNVSILTGACMTHNFETRQTLLASCPYNTHRADTSDFFITLPSNISDLNGFMCGHLSREGDLCHSCTNDTGPSLLRNRVGCYDISQPGLKWCLFLTLQVVPPVTFFLIILFCKVRATAGPLNAFILFCQIMSWFIEQEASSAKSLYPSKHRNSTAEGALLFEAVGTFYALWNNQVFWKFKTTPSSNISVIQIISLNYLSAVFPLFLIALSWAIIKVYHRLETSVLVTALKKFFLHCLRKFKVQDMTWDPIDSIIHAFATFILLSYTKVIVVSFNLLAPSRVYNQSGQLDYQIMPYDASLHFLSHGHLPYVVLALFMLTMFCGLPFLVLCLHPMDCFQRCLDKLKVSSSARLCLRAFTDAYTGCYRDRTDSTMDCRYFAAGYFLLRFVILCFVFFIHITYLLLSLILLSLITSATFLILQPYREKWLNTVDSISFLLFAVATLLYMYSIYVAFIPKWLPDVFLTVPLLYFLLFMSVKIYLKVRGWCGRKCGGRQEEEGGESMFARVSAREREQESVCEGERVTETSPLNTSVTMHTYTH